MKLALLADIHANLEALEACLSHAREQGASACAFLGDLVGYGADPAAVIARVRALVRAGAWAVRGNHDHAVAQGGGETMTAAAQEAVAWTRSRLSSEDAAFLGALPLSARAGDALLVHGSAFAPHAWNYVTDPFAAEQSLAAAGDARYVFCGHVHEPALYYTGASRRPLPFRPVAGVAIPIPSHRRWLAVAGAVGQARDGNTAASYALHDTEARTLTFFRVPYDWQTTAEKMRAAGLPELLARRLAHGE